MSALEDTVSVLFVYNYLVDFFFFCRLIQLLTYTYIGVNICVYLIFGFCYCKEAYQYKIPKYSTLLGNPLIFGFSFYFSILI